MRQLLAVLTVTALLTNVTFAAAPSAVLHTSGMVQINGTPVSNTTTVFAGDRIQTIRDSGSVSLPGSSIVLTEGSQIVYGSDSLQFIAGTATIKTSKQISAAIRGISVKPVSASAKYTISELPNGILISSLEGALAVGPHMTLPAGKAMVLKAASPATTAAAGCKDNKKIDEKGDFLLDAAGHFISCLDQQTAGGGATQPAVDTTAGGVPNWVVVTGIAAAGAAGGISVAIIMNDDKAPVSPAVP